MESRTAAWVYCSFRWVTPRLSKESVLSRSSSMDRLKSSIARGLVQIGVGAGPPVVSVGVAW